MADSQEVNTADRLPPVSSYDMGSVGLAGYVTPRGWVELHNPASSRLSIKQFNINNCGNRVSSGKATDAGEDIMEIGEFRLALRTLRTAMAFVMPWNFSVQALEGFFIQSKFCNADLSGVEKQAQFLTQFTDYVLEQNSDRWRDSVAFLSTGELKSTWDAFFGSKPVSVTASKPRKSADKPKVKVGEKNVSLGICYAWNRGQCLKAETNCTTAKGRPLKHICNFLADISKPLEVCGKDHSCKDFHK
jgi:hypothetical protein